jgi:hypothetical protein
MWQVPLFELQGTYTQPARNAISSKTGEESRSDRSGHCGYCSPNSQIAARFGVCALHKYVKNCLKIIHA